ncbi:MAG: oxidoreductase, partial [Bacteroidales bacterium]
MEKRTAIVFGATGLVGNLLLEELEKAGNYSAIRIFVRQTAGISSPVVREIITDFSNIQAFGAEIKGDDLFICLGTTIKKAGSVENMEKIDRDLSVEIALLARK